MITSTYSLSAELAQLEVARLWQQGLTGSDVGIGHLDTGVDLHPVLKGNVAKFVMFDDWGHPIADRELFDSGVHGTHTAGLICGGEVEGIAIGAAPGASLYSGVVINGGQTILRILRGLCWLAEQPIRAAVLPLGIPGNHPVLKEAVDILRSRGILPIAPIGNKGAGNFQSPGVYPNVLSVGASDCTGQIASFSGSLNASKSLIAIKPDVLAPGDKVTSLAPGGGKRAMSGTSMSSAFVAGISALLFEAYPEADIDSVEAALIRSGSDERAVNSHRCRSGLVNASAALKHLQEYQVIEKEISKDYASAVGVKSERFIDPYLIQQFFYQGKMAVLSAIIGFDGAFMELANEVNNQVPDGLVSVEQLTPTRLVLIRATAGWLKLLVSREQVTLASDVNVDMAAVLFG